MTKHINLNELLEKYIINHSENLSDTQKEIMRVEKDTIQFLVYHNTLEQLPEWYDQSDVIEDIDDFTSENEYKLTFFDNNLSVEEEMTLEQEIPDYEVNDSESESDYENEWTTV